MTLVAESDALHVRVRAFARESLSGAGTTETFDELGLALARFQAKNIPGFRRLVELRRATLTDVASIPAVPVDAFRLTRIAAHEPSLDVVRFVTSGTTNSTPGTHAMRTTATYRALSLAWGSRALLQLRPDQAKSDASQAPSMDPEDLATRPFVVALATPLAEPPTSSLGFMMRAFMAHFEAGNRARSAWPDVNDASRWLLGPSGVNVDGLRIAADRARLGGAPLLLLATSFALVMLLDALLGAPFRLPPGSAVMMTGGFKGRTREVAPGALVSELARALDIPEPFIVGEYGMTELTSQFYEGTLPGAALSARRGVYLAPPWLRAEPVDPETLAPVSGNEAGIARFVDLGNVDSAVAVVTQDLIRRADGGIEWVGRRPGAPPRGCSLAVEDMIQGARPP